MSVNTQTPFDIAVVMATVVRPTLAQATPLRLHATLRRTRPDTGGIDRWEGERALLDALVAECPSHMAVTQVDLGYSTSHRNGGLYPGSYGGRSGRS